ncbi:MAG: hypothetical protein R6V06_08380 [Kiritimatiellia bacterium]
MKSPTVIYPVVALCLVFLNLRVAGVELKRSQWLKKIGTSIMEERVLKETFAQVPDSDKIEFVQRAMKAVSRMPVDPEKRAANFVNVAVACIQGAKGDLRFDVIAEVFATVPVTFLPVVTEELSKRFDQNFNKLSEEAYEKIAASVVERAAKRNAMTEDTAVRDTFVVLAFLRGTNNADLETNLLARFSDDRTKRLVAGWLPAALNSDYDALLAAADVQPLKIDVNEFQRVLGHSIVQPYLFRMRSDKPYAETRAVDSFNNSWISFETGFDQPTDFGINRVPRPVPEGYQNQTFNTDGWLWDPPPCYLP